MHTPRGGLWPALIAITAASVLAIASPAAAAKKPHCNDNLTLHAGSCGQKVKDVQWLLAGHRPNVYTKVKPTFKAKPNGAYGARTKAAVKAYKFRIGYPGKGQCGARSTMITETAGSLFFRLLEGTTLRPACWISLAASRVKAVEPGASVWALKAKAYEVHLLELNIHETPDGSNRGPAIDKAAFGVPAMQSATGAYGLAWCVSTQQTVFKTIGYGTFADASAGVYYVVDYYAARSLVFAKPKVGALVAFVDYNSAGHRIPGTGHMGYVVKVTATGFVSIEGNSSNRLLERFHQLGDRGSVFIRLPGVA